MQKEAASMARLRATDLALAIEQYQADHDGELPRNLQRLVPDYVADLPIDPWNGEPLCARFTSDGYSIHLASPVSPEGGTNAFPPHLRNSLFRVGPIHEIREEESDRAWEELRKRYPSYFDDLPAPALP